MVKVLQRGGIGGIFSFFDEQTEILASQNAVFPKISIILTVM